MDRRGVSTPGDGNNDDRYRRSNHQTSLGVRFATTVSSKQERQLPSFVAKDSREELESVRSWKSTSRFAKEAETIYRAPSLLDPKAVLEVKKRRHGWHTVGIVGGPTKSIYHGVFRTDEKTGTIDPYALGPSEYIRAMASVALCLSALTTTTSTGSSSSSSSTSTSSRSSPVVPLRFLHMGYGSGSLMRLLQCSIPKSQHLAIDLDPTVLDAAVELGLIDPSSNDETLLVGDALEYSGIQQQQQQQSSSLSPFGFHGICIDVFDGANLMPPGFYSVPFLEKLRDNLLEKQKETQKRKREGRRCAFVIHNFHVGTEPLRAQLEQAMESYRIVFGGDQHGAKPTTTTTTAAAAAAVDSNATNDGAVEPQKEEVLAESVLDHSLYRVDSLNTNNHGGNTILIAVLDFGGVGDDDDDPATTTTCSTSSTATTAGTIPNWLELATLAMERWEGRRFDITSRIEQIRPF